MKGYFSGRVSFLCSMVVSLALPSGVFGSLITYSKGGDATAASIQDTVDDFRAALGDPNNGNAAGPLGSGRREINWDGGGAVTATTSPTPFDGFLNNRGALFTTPGTGFIQAPPSGFPTDLSSTFGVFSPLRLFSAIDSNITDVSFFIPGTNGLLPATVSGFGAVFTDVDLYKSTSIQFYDVADNLIFNEYVPVGTVGDKSLSFLGAIGDAGAQISRVRITSGNAPSLSIVDDPEKKVDLVAMDDFIYGEPQGVPESGGIGLIVLGLGFVLFCHRRFFAVA